MRRDKSLLFTSLKKCVPGPNCARVWLASQELHAGEVVCDGCALMSNAQDLWSTAAAFSVCSLVLNYPSPELIIARALGNQRGMGSYVAIDPYRSATCKP